MWSRLAVVALLLAPEFPSEAADSLKPSFASEVAAPDEKTVLPLLRAVCGDGVRMVRTDGRKAFGCGDAMDEIIASRNRARRYPWTPYISWEAAGVIFGHFLSPTSEDVAINCNGCSSHPDLWGGTLLLTRKSGRWEPVWFKTGIITGNCRRVSLATGRQILFCEETDGGMGHRVHGLYTVDFKNPKFAWHSVVLMADSYSSIMNGGVQTQTIDRVTFDEKKRGDLLVRIYARHGRTDLRQDYKSKYLPEPKVANYVIEFRLDGKTFKVTPQSAVAARRFGVEAR